MSAQELLASSNQGCKRLERVRSLCSFAAFFMLMFTVVGGVEAASERFTVNFGANDQAKTIGDLRPKVIPLNKKPVPDVSINYVMKRYRKLFEKADSPEVRIEALDRLNHLSASYGVYEKGLTVDPYVQAEVVLSTYQRILDMGQEYQRMDELLYQTAKATAFTGQMLESIKRLELLIGLYPSSHLYEEALFRLGESYFDLAEFDKAKSFYLKLLKRTKAPRLSAFADYKLAWTEYRLDNEANTLQSLANVFESYRGVYGVQFSTDLDAIPMQPSAYAAFDLPTEAKVLPDAMRLLALMSEKGDKIANIKGTALTLGGKEKESVVLRALVDQLSEKQRFVEAAQLIESYVEQGQSSYALLAYSKHAVELYTQADYLVEAWKSKEKLVKAYGLKSDFWNSSSLDTKNKVRPLLSELVLELAHMNFVRMQELTTLDQRKLRYANEAATYYLQHAALNPNTLESFDSIFIAAQALDQSKRYNKAVQLFTKAGYTKHEHESRAASAYSAFYSQGLAELKDGIAADLNTHWSDVRTQLAQRYLDAYPLHKHAASTALALGREYVAQQNPERALALFKHYPRFAHASLEQSVTAQMDLAALYYNKANFVSSEASYRESLRLLHGEKQGALPEFEEAVVIDGIVNSMYHQASVATDSAQQRALYSGIFDEFPSHKLAPDALFNAASLAFEQSLHAEAINFHYAFLAAFPEHELGDQSRQKLIVSLEAEQMFHEAAEQLMVQARRFNSAKDEKALSANSAYAAAAHFVNVGMHTAAQEAYEWLIEHHDERSTLVTEALAFFFEQSSGAQAELDAAKRLLAYIESQQLSDARARTLGAQAALLLAAQSRDAFMSLDLTLPFAKSLKAKTKLLEQCSAAYQRAIAFGISEYNNAARYEMARIYQSLAVAIMDSERPEGLSALEQEQYEVLLEERAIPIEDEAIALYEQNINTHALGNLDPWLIESYRALAVLNPSMYHRPLLGPSYAPLER